MKNRELKKITEEECNNTTCGNCKAYDEDCNIKCYNLTKLTDYAKAQGIAKTKIWLKKELTHPAEILFWKDEFDITIIPEIVEIVNIDEEKLFGCGSTIIFEAKINKGEPIKIRCNTWHYSGGRYEPDDDGLEFDPL